MYTYAQAKADAALAPPVPVPSRVWERNRPLFNASGSSEASIFRKASCSCGGGCSSCNMDSGGLKVSQPGEAAEVEADQVADRIMRMPMPTAQPITNSTGTNTQSQDHVRQTIGSGGRPLDAETRGFFEPRLGYDLGSVRIHTGDRANDSAQSLGAQAYTLGNDIVFKGGKYSPDSDSGKHLLAHELAHVVQQQTGAHAKAIQKMDDATFEAGTGIAQGIKDGTMAKDAAVDGKTFTVSCGFKSYDFSFKFSKGYKGDYPYAAAAGKSIRGIYVKIEASIKDKQKCGRCTPMHLIQVTRDSAKNAAGVLESVKPTSATRETRGGWADPKSPSRGWYVDTTDTSTKPFVTNLPHTSQPGDETKPAILWDPPGYWATDTNKGGDFYTCAICQDLTGKRWTAACIQWGSYTDSSGKISFNPATPVASCGSIQTVQDASERWDGIAGNSPTGIKY